MWPGWSPAIPTESPRFEANRRHPFSGLGYRVAEGPEVESDQLQLHRLNIPPDSPGPGNMQDTFLLSSEVDPAAHAHLTVQIRTTLESNAPPVRTCFPAGSSARCGGCHPLAGFHQVEVLAIDEGLDFSHLRGPSTFLASSSSDSAGALSGQLPSPH